MHTPLCDELGIEFPIFAFTHCRDVVAAVSKAGGFGVLGAVGFTPEQLEVELDWIDEHVGDKPYGVDIVIPGKYEGMDDDWTPRSSPTMLRRRWCPQEHLDFADKLLRRPRRARAARRRRTTRMRLLGWTEATATPQIEVALRPPEGEAHRQRARHAAGRGHRPHPRRPASRSRRCAARRTRR